MSFGYGVGDVITVSSLALKVIQNTRQALGQYDELTREVTSLHIVLKKLQAETTNPESWLHRIQDSEKQDLDSIVNGCSHVLQDLDTILEKYSMLREEKRSVTKLWQRVRFGAGEMQDLSQIRIQVTSHSSSLALSLHLISLGSSGRVERQMAQQIEMQRKILDAAGPTDAGNRESTLTTYENDDKGFWKEFRRDLVAEGWSSEVMARHRDLITAYIRELASKGALDIGDGLQSRLDRTAHQPSETTQTVVDTNGSGGSMPDSIDNSNIAAMDFSFDFENEAVRSRIYTRVLASASVRNSILYLSDDPAPGYESQESPLVVSSEQHRVFDSTKSSSTSDPELNILETEAPRSPSPGISPSPMKTGNLTDYVRWDMLPGRKDSKDLESIYAAYGSMADIGAESSGTSEQSETRVKARQDLAPLPLQQRAYKTIERSSPMLSKPLAAVPSQPDADVLVTRQPQASNQIKRPDSIYGGKAKPAASRTGSSQFLKEYKLVVVGGGGVDKSGLAIQVRSYSSQKKVLLMSL